MISVGPWQFAFNLALGIATSNPWRPLFQPESRVESPETQLTFHPLA
jgi:hypothetical protein